MSLEIFYEENKDTMIRNLTIFSGDGEAANDAVQSGFLKALENGSLTKNMSQKALYSWLYTAAKNSLIDDKRKTAIFHLI